MTTTRKVIDSILLINVLVLGYGAICGIRTTRIETLRNAVERNVRIGDSSDVVLRFLDSQHLEHSSVRTAEGMSIAGRKYEKNSIVILAIKPKTAEAAFWIESIQIVFLFNEDNQLISFEVLSVRIGL